jgi:F-type H+-transporting ATPase subunit delta
LSPRVKSAQLLARQLFQLSLDGGAISPERVGGVLAWVERHKPSHPILVLQAYRRLVAAELARGRAEVEHAGPVSAEILQNVAAAMTRRYGRKIAAESRPNPSLLAGLRVRVGDDVYDASASGRLAALDAA